MGVPAAEASSELLFRNSDSPPQSLGTKDQAIKQAAIARLPDMRRQLKKLQGVVDELVSRNGRSVVDNSPSETS